MTDATLAGRVLTEGDTVKDFRGQVWEFVTVSRLPRGASTGRVLVRDEFGRAREFFPSVFDIAISADREES